MHVFPVRHYLVTFGWLIVLLVLTVWVYFLRLGFLAIYIAMGIATLKAVIVAMNFMHLRESSRLSHVWAGAGVLFLLFLFGLAMSDYKTRWFEVDIHTEAAPAVHQAAPRPDSGH